MTIIDTTDTPWSRVAAGIEEIRLSHRRGSDPYTTFLVRLGPGRRLPDPQAEVTREILVFEGACALDDITLEEGDYSRRAPGYAGTWETEDGCTLLVKTGASPPPPEETVPGQEVVLVQTMFTDWLPGQGNLKVMPLHSVGSESSALVLWPANERFQPHKHWGGEEILVLRGTFMDEYGVYPKGTWMQSPHLSSHHPFVEKETLIYVKTGHLPPVDE
ncbi:ChrR Cupin-like domain protein [Planctomycetes bacterium Poly30]|uniref:ChrR Cupin-like domain protein n=1 Tax=Saltatorellus ferox TaxID=2528018 RepID=A0A518EML5_9BACT|nr:ChrR Cupin-like domain protein [Planctomycetes bacterium Poly30]